MRTLEPGMKVICIKTPEEALTREAITVGHIYTLRDVEVVTDDQGETLGVRLEEVKLPKVKTFVCQIEMFFLAELFAPLDDGRISVFRELLAPEPVAEPA